MPYTGVLPEGMRNMTDATAFRGAYAARREHHMVGIMSGTSLDGVDAVVARIRTSADGGLAGVSLVSHAYIPYSDALRRVLGALCTRDGARIDDLTYAHYGLSEWYARAASDAIRASGLGPERIDAISMHGQTVWHAPEPRAFPGPGGADLAVKGTLQLGSPAVVAERTGLPVIADLRARDMAAGGEGAPLAPYLDALLFGSADEARVVQNIGGIGNATVLPAGAAGQAGTRGQAGVTAFDTGPGNMVMDAVVMDGTRGAMRWDDSGGIAARGRVHEAIVEHLMADPYFARMPPKSTGREVYGAPFVRGFLASCAAAGLSFEDRVATATAFTAESIARACRDFILPSAPIGRLIVAGGGAQNPVLMGMIEGRLAAYAGRSIPVLSSVAFGVPDQAREAMAFAVLGHESLMGRPGNLPAVTGASRAVVLGSVTL